MCSLSHSCLCTSGKTHQLNSLQFLPTTKTPALALSPSQNSTLIVSNRIATFFIPTNQDRFRFDRSPKDPFLHPVLTLTHSGVHWIAAHTLQLAPRFTITSSRPLHAPATALIGSDGFVTGEIPSLWRAKNTRRPPQMNSWDVRNERLESQAEVRAVRGNDSSSAAIATRIGRFR